MRSLLHPRALAGLTLAAGLMLSPATARAGLPLIVKTRELMDGVREHSEIIVQAGGAIAVKPVGSGLGSVHLRANRIVIEAGGAIEASGAGYPGKDGSDGGAPPSTTASGKVAGASGDPGTGGASVGVGGKGTGSGCTLLNAPEGGVPYSMPSLLELGAAGGAGRLADLSLASRGGSGGGRITLEASVIEINGLVSARGEDGINPGGVGSGGGAGGAIKIIAGQLTGAGIISVTGGNGGAGVRSGGGGGGGVILLLAPTAMPATLTTEINGGTSGTCNTAGKGGSGVVLEQVGAACLDADGDTHTSAACGGADCDDADSAIHPPNEGEGEVVRERCDGQDNDCSGAVDDDLPDGACPDGMACVSGACVAGDEPPDPGNNAGPAPDHIEFAGGCRAAGPGAGPGLFGAAAALALAVRCARGRLKRRPRRSAP